MKTWIGLALATAAAWNLWAQAPEMFRYQGRLVDGTNLVNATLPMSFKLYNALSDGTKLYEDSNSVLVVDGLYSTMIGDNTISGSLTNALTNATVYLELTVDGEALSPRERLVSVPYALNAGGDSTPSGGVVLSETYPNSELEAQGYSITEAVPGENWMFMASAPEDESYDNPLSFAGKMWVFEDYNGIPVWNSEDGRQWKQATAAIGCEVYRGFSVAVFRNKMWLLGGRDSGGYSNDIWCSIDGTNWTLAVDDPAWSPREKAVVTTFDGKIWLLGGLNDVWCSADGTNWILATATAPWESDRVIATAFKNKLWVYYNDYDSFSKAWCSTNGIDWRIASTNISLYEPTSICIINDEIYGLDDAGIHSSNDGTNWIFKSPIYWENDIYDQTLLSHNSFLWYFGDEVVRSDTVKQENGLYYYRKN